MDMIIPVGEMPLSSLDPQRSMALGAVEMLNLARSIFQTESHSDKEKP